MHESEKNKQQLDLLIEKGELEQALTLCLELIDKEGYELDLLQIHASLLKDLQRLDEAIEAYHLLIQLHQLSGNYLKAIALTKILAEFAPQFADELTQELILKYRTKYRSQEESTQPSLPPFVIPEKAKDNPIIKAITDELDLPELPPKQPTIQDKTLLDMKPFSLSYAVEPSSHQTDQASSPSPSENPTSSPVPPTIEKDKTILDLQAFLPEEEQTKQEEEKERTTDEFDSFAELTTLLPNDFVEPPPLPPLFSQLDSESFAALLGKMRHLTFDTDQEIIRQGTNGTSFYIIINGSVRVMYYNNDVEEEITRLGKNEFFGEIALLTPLRRTASVIANEPTEVLILDRQDIQGIIEQYPQIYEELKKFVYQRLIQNLLTTCLIFFPLTDKQRWALAEEFNIIEVLGGQSLLIEGQKADAFYIIAAGEAATYRTHPNGEMSRLSQLSPGHFAGEVALLNDAENKCSLITQEACIVLKLSQERFHEVMDKFPKTLQLLKIIADQRGREMDAYDFLWSDYPTSTPIP